MTIHAETSGFNSPVALVPFSGSFQPVARRFSVDEYHQMIDSGILTTNDRVQLLDGWIIEMPPIGPRHGTCTTLSEAAIRSKLPAGWFVRSQLPITLDRSEPEPDIVVVRGGARDYSDRHPTAPDVALVIEVADSTLEFDRRQKTRAYAAAGITEYWILNLVDRQLEAHRDPQATASGPDFRTRKTFDASQAVPLILDGREVAQLKVADFLP